MPQEDTGLVKRGMLLLGLMSALVVVLLVVMFQRGGQALPKEASRTQLAVDLIGPAAPFPASISWPTVFALGDTLPSAPGWEVRYNAAAAIARQGFANVPWTTFREMLDEDRQMRNFRVQLQDGKEVPDEAAARLTLLSALRALSDWHKKQKAPPEATPEQTLVYAAVDRLAESPIVEIKTQADKARKTFFR